MTTLRQTLKLLASLLAEASEQMTLSEFLSWTNRHFDIKEMQSKYLLSLGRLNRARSNALDLPCALGLQADIYQLDRDLVCHFDGLDMPPRHGNQPAKVIIGRPTLTLDPAANRSSADADELRDRASPPVPEGGSPQRGQVLHHIR